MIECWMLTSKTFDHTIKKFHYQIKGNTSILFLLAKKSAFIVFVNNRIIPPRGGTDRWINGSGRGWRTRRSMLLLEPLSKEAAAALTLFTRRDAVSSGFPRRRNTGKNARTNEIVKMPDASSRCAQDRERESRSRFAGRIKSERNFSRCSSPRLLYTRRSRDKSRLPTIFTVLIASSIRGVFFFSDLRIYCNVSAFN